MDYRIYDKSVKPDDSVVIERVGGEGWKLWGRILEFISSNYSGVFPFDDWLYVKQYGWYLRFKKSRSYCTLYPIENGVKIQIVFGKAEREKAEAILPQLSGMVRTAYLKADTYHDGKWLFIDLEDSIMDDIELLLKVKRKPKVS